MQDDLAAKIATRMAELPDDVRQAIQSSDLDDRIRKIGQKHQLHIDQMENLSQEIYLTMLAFAEPERFVDNVVEQVRIPREKAEAIAKDVNSEIFLSIRESMKAFSHEQVLLDAAPQVSVPALAPGPKQPLASVLPASTPAPAAVPTPPSTPAPVSTPASVPIPPIVQPPPVIKPAPQADMHAAEVMLREKTAEVAPSNPIYKKDPYREPAE